MKDEEAIDWKEGFQDFHWTRRPSSRRGDGRWGSIPHMSKEDLMCFWEEKEEDECVREKIVLMCGKNVVHEKKKYVQTKNMGGSCV
jgi:hypothetical protein